MSLSPLDEALQLAIENGDLSAAKSAIEDGADPVYQNGDAILTAARYGYLDIFAYYTDELANNGYGMIMNYLTFAFIEAVQYGRLNIVQHLVSNNYVVITNDISNIDTMRTVLSTAAAGGYLDIITYLHTQGADLNIDGGEILKHAASEGHYDIVKYLVENSVNGKIGDAFILAAGGGHLRIMDYLFSQGVGTPEQGLALIQATSFGSLEATKYLIDKDVNINIWNGAPLLGAAQNGHADIVEYLISKGADPNSSNGPPLLNTVKNGHLDVVMLLVSEGAIISQEVLDAAGDLEDDTILYFLTHGSLPEEEDPGEGDSSKDFTDKTKDLEYKNLMDEITYAAEKNDIAFLLDIIINSTDRDFAGKYALLASIHYNRVVMVKYIVEEEGVDVTFEDNYPIILAAYYGHLEIVKYLISRGASRSEALPYAIEAGHQDVIDYLSEKKYHRKRRVMSSFCRTKPSCPTPPTGYNVCIENDTELDQVYLFGPLPATGAVADVVNTQSVTVPRNTSICYRILSPIGTPMVVSTADPLIDGNTDVWGVIACSVHITTRTVVANISGILTVDMYTTLDCSPCPCPCEFTCAPEKKACESVTGSGFGLGFGFTKKMAELCLDTCPPKKTCSDGTSFDVPSAEGWMFS